MAKSERLDEIRRTAAAGGGEERIQQQRAKGKLTARERLDLLVDEGCFTELDAFVMARPTELRTRRRARPGRRRGHRLRPRRRPRVYVFSQDFTVFGGSLSEAHAEKICKVMDLAMKTARRSSGSTTPAARASRKASCPSAATPRSSCATRWRPASCRRSARSWGPAPAARFTRPRSPTSSFMVEGTSYMFVTGPDVVKTVTHEDVDFEELGGAMTHTREQRRRALRGRDDEVVAVLQIRATAGVPAVEQRGRSAARREPTDPPDREDPRSTRSSPTIRTSPTTCTA